MKVCFVCNEYPEGPHGGIGTMTQLLAEELAAGNHSVKVIGVYDLSYPAPGFELINRVEITRLRANYASNLSVFKGYWILGRTIRNWIKNNEVDIIESPDSYGLLSILPKFSRPLVLRAHGNNTYFSSILKLPIKNKTLFYERNLYKKAFGYCAVSEFTASRMKSLFDVKKPFTIIYNGIEIIKENLPEDNMNSKCKEIQAWKNPIIFSGTLTKKKGIYELVKAIIFLLNKGTEVTLIINGKDTTNKSTGNSVKEELLNLIPEVFKQNFIFNGHITRSELLCQYKYSTTAIFPSFAEAFAIAPMEAMSVGIPTIFSKECSGSELISDKVDGLLIDPSSEESIAQAIMYILNDPEEAKRIGHRGQEKILINFSKKVMSTKTLQFYENIRAIYNC